MRVIILGGNRFVGRKVANLLAQTGNAVTVVHRSPPSTREATTMCGDRNDPTVLSTVLATEPDAILDMSLYNATSAHMLVQAIKDRAVRYVAVSTAAIYSQSSPPPWNELTPIKPAAGWGEYGIGKAEADSVVITAGLANALVVRPPYFIGAGDPDKRCDFVFARRSQGLPVPIAGDGSSLIQTIDADDMALALIELLKSNAVGVMDISGTPPISVKAFTQQCVATAGHRFFSQTIDKQSSEYRPELFPFPNLPLWVEGRRFREECSVRPRPLADTLKRAWLEWQKLA
jgi:nucleoside-diphosphate-sugar epimerase